MEVFICVVIYAAMFFSGIAGLGYQLIWVRMLSVSLGHEFVAMLAVITAFFCGLAFGALAINKRIKLTGKAHILVFFLRARYSGLGVVINFYNTHI